MPSLSTVVVPVAREASIVPDVGAIARAPYPARSRTPAAARAAGLPDYVVNVSRPVPPWRWTSLLLMPVELLVVAWSVPVAILLVAIPIALILWMGLFAWSFI
jgi:hypothetical protein